jgi:hypothetical protein
MNTFEGIRKPGKQDSRGIVSLVFMPDSRGLLTVDAEAVLWELATGRERWRSARHHFRQAAFSPDGKVVALGSATGAVHVLETLSGTEVGRFQGHRGAATGLAFAPSGKTFSSGGDDGTALLWDAALVCKKAVPAIRPLKPEQLSGLWRELAADDAARAGKAIRSLVAAPEQAVPMLRGRLQGGTKEDLDRFAALLKKLDARVFAVREAAQKELEALDELPLELLRKEAEENPSAEVRLRLKRVVAARREVDPESKRLRTVRGVETLERIGTAEARTVLQSLAERAPETWLKQEAKGSLERLQKR